MYKVFKDSEFSAAHSLRGYKGRCENLHGHNWKVRVQLLADELDSLGMVIDFEQIKKILAAVISKLDHQDLNKVAPFDRINPTSENIARYLFDEVSKKLVTDRVKIDQVMVWEKQSSCAIFQADQDA